MKKILVVAVVVLALAAVAFVGYRAGWFARSTPGARPSAGSAGTGPGGNAQPASGTSGPAGSGAPAPTAASPSATPVGPEATASLTPLIAPSAYTAFVDLASADLGGRIENAGAGWETRAHNLIDGNPATAAAYGSTNLEAVQWVIAFYDREPAVISGVVFNQPTAQAENDYWNLASRERWAKDVEVWVGMDAPPGGFGESAAEKNTTLPGFTKVAAAALRAEMGDQPVTFAPVEARYVEVRILSSQGGQPAGSGVALGKIKVMEGQRAGYVPLLARHPELAALKSGQVPWQEQAKAALAAASSSAGSTPSVAAGGVCAPVSSAPKTAPAHPESRNVLVVSPTDGFYRPAEWAKRKYSEDYKPRFAGIDMAIFDRIHTAFVPPQLARPAMLAPVDTVALVGLCAREMGMVPEVFKRTLAGWAAAGHKLIIQDSDWCGDGPDYSFLPYRFATSNPGAQGARSDRLLFVEENTIGNARRGDPAFVDLEAWLSDTADYHNELGDSNTIVQYDPHWCGHLLGTNVLKKNGFVEAYAHYGRGLIIYNGFDLKEDQGRGLFQILARELAQPFDPDGLPCAAPLSDFVITTEQRLRMQALVPGKRYAYPLTLLSNQGYSGRVKLSGTSNPASTGLAFTFEPDSVDLTEISNARLTVATAANTPVRDHVLAVRGTDAAGKTSTLCLTLGPPRTGTLQVVSALPRAKHPTKNLEIILDASGSMKTPLGKGTRMATARAVLRSVVARIPDDFNVGLRFYGHRYGSRQKETCTDSELVRSIEKIDRADLLAKVDAVQPRGETPLIYSVLQTPADLEEVGGGSVVLVTDGEESCGGDARAAAQKLKDAGIDVTLNIVGFTLKGKAVEQQLATLAESTGGRYYSAQSGEALASALLIAAIERIPYTIYDAAGKRVAEGEAGGPGENLPPGDYKVVIAVADQQLVADRVAVAAGADVMLKVVFAGDRLALQR